jgi:hypothetical protein
MPSWVVYDYVDRRDRNVVAEWLDTLDSRARAKVDAKIQALRQYGGALPTTMLSDTDEPRIKKLRVRGRVNWRVLLCYGPVDLTKEFTLLHAVHEKDNKMPEGATQEADARRHQVAADPDTRRTRHEF